MGLHPQWVLGLRQNLQHFIIGQEEEAGSGIGSEYQSFDMNKESNKKNTAKECCLPWEKEALLLQIGIQSFHDAIKEDVRILQFL